MQTINIEELTIGEIVANDFRTASIFKDNGIDFCCGGKQTIAQACKNKDIDIAELEKQILELEDTSVDPAQNFKEWKLDFLCDYIVNTHHAFIEKTMPQIVTYTQKIALVHGDNHPELTEVADLFLHINEELLQHARKEEDVLFPAIKEALNNPESDGKALILIQSEIERMYIEHEYAGGAMDKINVITGNYALPADACGTYQVAFKLLKQFEDDLHVHVHLENNILYPKALQLVH